MIPQPLVSVAWLGCDCCVCAGEYEVIKKSELASERAAVQGQLSQLSKLSSQQESEINKWRQGRMIMLQWEVWSLAVLYSLHSHPTAILSTLPLSVLALALVSYSNPCSKPPDLSFRY